jgi:hypothetical protein
MRTRAQRLEAKLDRLRLVCETVCHRWETTGWQGDFGDAVGSPVFLECKRCGKRAKAVQPEKTCW